LSLLEAIVLGIVQGLTEFLPISSTAHLKIVPKLLGWSDPGASFSAVIQLGTVLAVLGYFRKDLWEIAAGVLQGLRSGRPLEDERSRLGIYIAAATVPIVVFGLLFQEEIRTGLRSLYVISASLILVGVAMAWADRRLTLFGPTKREVGFADAMFVGMAQALALIPGVSRSGSTIAAALFRGLDRAEAARFSFLLSVPAVTAAGLKEGYELLSAGLGDEGIAALLAGTVSSFVVGYAAIAGLIAFLKRRSVMVFVGYRIALGLFLLVLLGAGVLEHLG